LTYLRNTVPKIKNWPSGTGFFLLMLNFLAK
jgi:hypothetical protein